MPHNVAKFVQVLSVAIAHTRSCSKALPDSSDGFSNTQPETSRAQSQHMSLKSFDNERLLTVESTVYQMVMINSFIKGSLSVMYKGKLLIYPPLSPPLDHKA